VFRIGLGTTVSQFILDLFIVADGLFIFMLDAFHLVAHDLAIIVAMRWHGTFVGSQLSQLKYESANHNQCFLWRLPSDATV
jgi:hypothetical protein